MSLADVAYRAVCKAYNHINRVLSPAAGVTGTSDELRQVEERARLQPSDISDHLATLFAETVSAHPRLIVELGVRGGESTFAFERAARLADAHLLSVDIEDCLVRCDYEKWSFVKQDDVIFADEFAGWCASLNLAPAIDVLFIDTSHLYEHTKAELRAWMPHLSPKGKMILHDTNMKKIYRRVDGSLGAGWNNDRGVIRALEETLHAEFDEHRDFVTVACGYIIRHWAHCNGLAVVERF
jgi:predicted O-methyltransferase YrrM